jgi:hypothetical protein
MKKIAMPIAGLLGAGILWTLTVRSLTAGIYGWTAFVALPALLGGLSCAFLRPTTGARAAGVGALTTAVAALLFLLVKIEGLICILMALPLIVPSGAIGGWVVYQARTSRRARGGLAAMMLLPVGTLGWDIKAQPPVFAVHTQVEIAATREAVWKQVVAFSPLPEPNEWFFLAGVAYPKRARIQGTGVGAVRYCEFSTGAFVEPIEVWDEPHLLRFRVTENPAPLQEWSPYGSIQTTHLHGYLVSKQGEFRLTKLPNGHTLLEGTTWYQHGLWPAQYWRWWSDAIIHRIHLRVLNHVKLISEQSHQ